MQARDASTLKTTLSEVFYKQEVERTRVGDEEMQHRIIIDDVIMGTGCKSAYIHIGAEGDTLEKRQVYVWCVRNKGKIKTAVSKRWAYRLRLPILHFVESKAERWEEMMQRARKYPEDQLPNPFDIIEMRKRKIDGAPDRTWKMWGGGDAKAAFPPRGFDPDHGPPNFR